MKVLQIQHRALKKLFPPRFPEAGQELRPFAYLVTGQVPEGLLVYQASLCDCVLLEGEEQELLRRAACPKEMSDTLRYLIEHRFLVAADQDDMAFCRKVREGAALIRQLTEEKGYSGFTILTTTACNARCFYCFEKGCKTETMTPETASAVAEFILKYGNQKRVRLSWFGGEPTVNARAIDQITGALTEAGREYASTMISNGYLMDETLVEKAAGPWKLRNIQITLDGTEEIYNKRKNYVNAQGSAFQRVLNNISLLLDAGIAVQIRLNVDEENVEDLCTLADQLAQRFRGQKKLFVYAAAIFEDKPQPVEEFRKRKLAQHRLRDHLAELGYAGSRPLERFPRISHCMADSGSDPVVMPDGSLNSCEHFSLAPAWGSVFEPAERPREVSDFWNEKYPEQPECESCKAFPSCIRLLHCQSYPVCTEELRADECEALTEGLRALWKQAKERQNHPGEQTLPAPAENCT